MPQYSKTLSQQLGEVSDMLSMSYVARAYFGKSRSWISQRLHGYNVNGKPVKVHSFRAGDAQRSIERHV